MEHWVRYCSHHWIRSTHSYIASTIFANLSISIESTAREFSMISSLGQSVPLEIQSVVFLADLMELPFGDIDCASKRVALRIDENSEDIRTVRDLFDVFSKEFSRVPSDREVEFDIDLLPGVALVSIAPYHMTSKELAELKAQLQELLD
ncbi:alcohol-forming fatty acyl-CoA reductase-like [Gossypium australe]|uniref:Alcohol-forming fatty acyl-CoA reductase-like n=1 Tax=Gossypium australe TaxID=47621 RepID=A0A5B6VWI1_9ROSI|nr:alcohol-forming fatty acyl-CoA reductase-like [Gossypium australe]